MSTGAIITMVLGCTALWGGFIVSVILNFKWDGRNKAGYTDKSE